MTTCDPVGMLFGGMEQLGPGDDADTRTHTLPEAAWVEGYYDVLGPRAKALLDHPDRAVREFAAEKVREIEIFERSEQSYGYVFYVLVRA